MSTKESVFKVLSGINVNKHTKEKGGLTYLPWAYAWGILQEHYPDSSYEFMTPVFYDNGSCEVAVGVTVDGVTRQMILPVMDYKNKAIESPTSRDISDNRMRCLVKCIAMFGLGLYIYGGDAIPESEEIANAEKKEKILKESVVEMVIAIEKNDSVGFKQLWHELDRDEQGIAWKGINTKEKKVAREMLNDEGNKG